MEARYFTVLVSNFVTFPIVQRGQIGQERKLVSQVARLELAESSIW